MNKLRKRQFDDAKNVSMGEKGDARMKKKKGKTDKKCLDDRGWKKPDHNTIRRPGEVDVD